MFMATKKDYHSCVYDILVDSSKVPSNINFSDTGVFEKLLQKSMPLTHKCFMTMDYSYDDELKVCDKWGDLTIENFFNETNDHNAEDDIDVTYSFGFDKMVKEDCHYTLSVSFKDDVIDELGWEDYEAYVNTTITFKENENSNTSLKVNVLDTLIKANYWTTLDYHFTAPENAHYLSLSFQSTNGKEFNYKDLTLTREEPLKMEELWN